jgi:hypothetical protein
MSEGDFEIKRSYEEINKKVREAGRGVTARNDRLVADEGHKTPSRRSMW